MSDVAVERQEAAHRAALRDAFVRDAVREYDRDVEIARRRLTEQLRFFSDPQTRFRGNVDLPRWAASGAWGTR